jgi:3-hydroxymyristoyl/3-hydroxydecanoyl-(acyl carrier protein) dehydratase
MFNEQTYFKDLYTKEAAGEGPPYHTVWTLPADFPLLDGHFPGTPIFPAVGIVDATLHFLKGVTKDPGAYIKNLSSAKFMSPITPDLTVRLELKPLSEKEWQADWKEAGTEKLLATLRVQLA